MKSLSQTIQVLLVTLIVTFGITIGAHATIYNPPPSTSSGGAGTVTTGTVATVGSPLTIGGSATTTIYGNGVSSTFGGPINVTGTLAVTGNVSIGTGTTPQALTLWSAAPMIQMFDTGNISGNFQWFDVNGNIILQSFGGQQYLRFNSSGNHYLQGLDIRSTSGGSFAAGVSVDSFPISGFSYVMNGLVIGSTVVSSTLGSSTLSVSGSFAALPVTSTVSSTLGNGFTYTYVGTGTNAVFTLPPGTSTYGRQYTIFDLSTSSITINRTSTDFISKNGVTSTALTITSSTPYTLYNDSVYWEVK